MVLDCPRPTLTPPREKQTTKSHAAVPRPDRGYYSLATANEVTSYGKKAYAHGGAEFMQQ